MTDTPSNPSTGHLIEQVRLHDHHDPHRQNSRLSEIILGGQDGLVNVLGSTLTRKTDVYLPLACGWEISVPATKTYTNQVIALLAVAGALAGQPVHQLTDAPRWIQRAIDTTAASMSELAQRFVTTDRLFLLGYGVGFGIALEGALKCKEVTGIPCEGLFSSEFKHGPLAMVQAGTPVLFTAPPSGAEMLVNHITEVTCRGGHAVVVAAPHAPLEAEASHFLPLPVANDLEYAVAAAIPFQLFSYALATAKDLDPDYPRNLSKTLTVDCLPRELREPAPRAAVSTAGGEQPMVRVEMLLGQQGLADVESAIIAEVLRLSGHNKSLAAKHLGLTRFALDRRLKKAAED